ncbi:peptidyl-tRNA hydrolase [Lineolata rhizophorae]|uniref:peptidyl-tRNA hydrolase n=1 Tax=Lineolata rhizophorae TaxID=578093 RepID=A0A6A6NKR1_9PEZI|nr:peptidyl-tRNA hydrolase [Lineolata rhizophorae]
MPPRPPVPLLVASIGNPTPAYRNTLHSAGHHVLAEIRALLRLTDFQPSPALGGGLVTRTAGSRGNVGDDWTLWQSESLMNVSGTGVKKALNAWRQGRGPAPARGGTFSWMGWSREDFKPEGKPKDGELVVVHDELELDLGRVRVRRGGSARGHNGLRSIMTAVGNTPFIRIGIGIGRPASREPNAVAEYVLRRMTPREKKIIEGTADEVIELLRDIAEGKR